jgi:hypothetical protein
VFFIPNFLCRMFVIIGRMVRKWLALPGTDKRILSEKYLKQRPRYQGWLPGTRKIHAGQEGGELHRPAATRPPDSPVRGIRMSLLGSHCRRLRPCAASRSDRARHRERDCVVEIFARRQKGKVLSDFSNSMRRICNDISRCFTFCRPFQSNIWNIGQFSSQI